jgi:hypothetical protein
MDYYVQVFRQFFFGGGGILTTLNHATHYVDLTVEIWPHYSYMTKSAH